MSLRINDTAPDFEAETTQGPTTCDRLRGRLPTSRLIPRETPDR
jgi:hypothetical protein